MKSRIKKLDKTARQLEIEVPEEMVTEVFNQVLEDIQKEAVIPGFRQGKAPLDIVRKKYQQDVEDEVKQRLIPQAYQKALDEHGIKPVSFPELSDVSIGPSGLLTFKAKVDAHPEVKIRKYKGLKATAREIAVTDEEADEALSRIRSLHSEFVEIDRPIRKGDYAICDVETFINGESVAKKRENMWIEADKESSMLGMGEELCGLEKGAQKEIEATLPKNYPDEKYAGKKAMFRVVVKDVREKKLPDLDDELAQKMGKQNMDEFRAELRAQLLQKKEYNSNVEMKNQIMEQLLKKNVFELPESMVRRQLKVLMEKAEAELAQKGLDKETIESHKEKLKAQLFKEAEKKVRLYFILDEIANIEGIHATDEQVDEWLKALADSYKQPFDEVKKYYQDHGLIDGLKEQLREEKTLDFLIKEAIVEKS